MTTVIVDNYDSFSYNLYQAIGSIDPDVTVVRNDRVTVDELASMGADRIVLSPGPGRPEDAGICVDAVRELRGTVPILGVCLGHQAICVAYGSTVTYASRLMHGKCSEAIVDRDSPLFGGVGARTPVGRYHSLAVDRCTLPPELKVTSVTADGEVMSVEDPDRKVFGLQFHPESILTPEGPRIIANFMEVRM